MAAVTPSPGPGTGPAARLAAVEAAIAAACQAAGRARDDVRLVAVSKLQPAEAVAAAFAAGQRDFAENYAQELRDKGEALAALGLRWHFIGPLQRNKVRLVAGRAALIHSVESEALVGEIAARVARERPRAPALTQDCLIQVNVAGEAQKSGCAPQELPKLLDAIAAAGGTLRCRGLMCIPPADDDPEAARPHFRRLRALRDEAAQHDRPHVALTELSMGMSHDFAIAIAEGATLVRIGTAIFGERPAP